MPSNPTLTWGVSSDVVNYQYCIDTSNNNTCNATWINTGTTASVALVGLAPATYFWQVRAVNGSGTTYANGSATSWWSLIVVQAPGAFNKTNPVNGSTSRPNPTLSWGASARAVSYQYCVNTSAACTSPAAWVSTGAATSAALTGLSDGVTYYWQVQAVNGGGTVDANTGTWWSFTLANIDAVGILNNGVFYLRNSNTSGNVDLTFSFGPASGAIPLVGDWDGNGSTTPGVYMNGVFYLRNSNTNGIADITFGYGPASGVIPLAGDWDGNGTTTIGIYMNGIFYLRNSNSNGFADLTFAYGPASGYTPVVGDWDGNGTTTVGIYRNAVWYLRNSNNNGNADLTFTYGPASGYTPVVGDWDGNGTVTVGVYRAGIFHLRNTNNNGIADLNLSFNPAAGGTPLAGKW